jgi:hypothetical protein
VFLCLDSSGEGYCKSPDEVDAVFWLTSEEVLAAVNAPEWTKESLRRAAVVLDRVMME